MKTAYNRGKKVTAFDLEFVMFNINWVSLVDVANLSAYHRGVIQLSPRC